MSCIARHSGPPFAQNSKVKSLASHVFLFLFSSPLQTILLVLWVNPLSVTYFREDIKCMFPNQAVYAFHKIKLHGLAGFIGGPRLNSVCKAQYQGNHPNLQQRHNSYPCISVVETEGLSLSRLCSRGSRSQIG